MASRASKTPPAAKGTGVTKVTGPRFDPFDNPGESAVQEADFLNKKFPNLGIKPSHVRAMLSSHAEFQKSDFRQKARTAEQERRAQAAEDRRVAAEEKKAAAAEKKAAAEAARAEKAAAKEAEKKAAPAKKAASKTVKPAPESKPAPKPRKRVAKTRTAPVADEF